MTMAVFFAGCAMQGQSRPTLYPPSDITADQAQRYRYECQNQAMMMNTADYTYAGTFMEGINIQQKQAVVFDNCLRSKGFSLMAASNGVPSTQVQSASGGIPRTANWRLVNQ